MSQLFKKFVILTIVLLSPLISLADDGNLDYLLGAGDSIRVVVFQNPELTTEARVTESGNITFPLIGEINVGGIPIRDAEKRIAKALIDGGFVQQPQVNIVLLQVVGNRVAVLGMVNRPARYPLDTFNYHLSEMIANAGGVSPNAGNGYAILSGVRSGQQYRYEVDLATLFFNNKKELDVLVKNGDVIYIVPGNQISVLGQVNRPGRYPLESIKEKLSDVLAMAGGIAATGSDTVIVSGLRDGTEFRKQVNIAENFLNESIKDEVLIQAGDQIYVHRAPVYYIYGEAQRPGSYRVERNMTVIQALAQGGGPTARGTQRNLKLYRRNLQGNVVVTTPVLTDAVQADDVIYVQESLF